MKPKILVAAMIALAFSFAGASVASAAPSKCVSSAKTKAKAKACSPAPTSVASKRAAAKASRHARETRATRGSKANSRVSRAVRKAAKLRRDSRRNASRRSLARYVPRDPYNSIGPDGEIQLALDDNGLPRLNSAAFYVVNPATNQVVLQKNARSVLPIASITKLMTAMVVLESGSSLKEVLTISEEDIDYIKGTGSRLTIGTQLTREEMLQLALMSSENRAASALARYYPGGRSAFIDAMNIKAHLLGMTNTRFYDSSGLTPRNVSTSVDLARMVHAAASYPLIRQYSTTTERYVDVNGTVKRYGATNPLVKKGEWSITVSKTGYHKEAGHCLVMEAYVQGQPLVIVLLDASGNGTRVVDAMRVKMWLDQQPERLATR